MSSGAGGRDQLGVLIRVARRPELRRIQLAFMAFAFSEHATWLAVLVFALERGGPSEVGAVALIQLVPCILLAPFAAFAGDRFPPQRTLAFGYAAQGASMAATAVAMASGAPLLAYAAATCAATCTAFTRPVMGSLLPVITHSPGDLVAANVVAGFIEQVGVFAGPLAAGAVMAVSSPATVFAIAAALTSAAALAVVLVEATDATSTRLTGLDAHQVLVEAFGGFAALRKDAGMRTLVWLGAFAGIAQGIGDVAFVTFAAERLGGGGGQSGLLAAAYGVGAVAGAVGVTRLLRSGQVSSQLLVSAGLLGLPLLALAGIGVLAPALAAFAMLGAGQSLLILTSAVTIQRRAPTSVLARVFGILEGLRAAAIAVGSLAVTVLTGWLSLREAFVVLAIVLPVAVVGSIIRLRRLGTDLAPVDELVVDRLLADPVLAPLPAPTIERLARGVTQTTVPAGSVIVTQGEPGHRYFLITAGTARVTVDGLTRRDLGPGRSFGEIALLRDVPRTATVTAVTAVQLVSIERENFLEAVTGHPRSLGAAIDAIDTHLHD